MEPLRVKREEFPMSNANIDGMIPMKAKVNNYEVCVKLDVPYITRGERTLYLQIIKPIGAGDHVPCIVAIPGSAFHEQNTRERFVNYVSLAMRGFVVAVLEYRGSECSVFPAQALDAKAGVHFMRENAKEYGIDKDNIVLMGDSSGGHTALLAGLSYGIDELEEEDYRSDKPIVKGIIECYAPINFLTMNEAPSSQDHRTADSPEGCLIGGKAILENVDLVKPTIITNYISKDRDVPPVLIFHGTNDELVPFEQTCELYETLTKAEKEATCYKVLGAHHGGREFWTNEVLDIEEHYIKAWCNKEKV